MMEELVLIFFRQWDATTGTWLSASIHTVSLLHCPTFHFLFCTLLLGLIQCRPRLLRFNHQAAFGRKLPIIRATAHGHSTRRTRRLFTCTGTVLHHDTVLTGLSQTDLTNTALEIPPSRQTEPLKFTPPHQLEDSDARCVGCSERALKCIFGIRGQVGSRCVLFCGLPFTFVRRDRGLDVGLRVVVFEWSFDGGCVRALPRSNVFFEKRLSHKEKRNSEQW